MDRRINYLIGIDTETANGQNDGDKLDLTQSIVYDIGWQVCDQQGRVYLRRSYVVYDVFCLMADLMKSAYYADKIPKYQQDIKDGKRTLASFSTIQRIFRRDCKNWGVKAVFAHNAAFDLRALNNTTRYLTKSRERYFFPFGTEIYDTMRMARQVIATQKGYQYYCAEHGYLTKNNQPRVTAEILTRYLRGDLGFKESHTGLEDVAIETEIFAHCVRQHKKMEKRLYPNRHETYSFPEILVWRKLHLNTVKG